MKNRTLLKKNKNKDKNETASRESTRGCGRCRWRSVVDRKIEQNWSRALWKEIGLEQSEGFF